MSAKRVDHAATAQALLAAADEHPHDPDIPVDPWTLQAQVHATLALVEQQRIANLISLMQMQAEIDESTDMLAHEALYALIGSDRKGTQLSGPIDVPFIRPEIREALGLT